PGKIISTSQEVEVMVLDVDPEKRRVSLGLKQCLDNPWIVFAESHPEGAVVEGEIKNITEFGLFVELPGEIYGMAHLSDLDWLTPGEEALKRFKKGDEVKAKVLTVDVDKERIGLGLKQLDDDPYQGADARRGKTVTCTVTAVHEHSVEVEIFGSLRGEIKRSDLARDRDEQRPSRFAPGDKVDAKLLQIDRNSRRISLSIKALEVQEEKKAVQDYGSTDSGASLGDILGAALDRKTQEEAARASEAEESADES
ncbi:MAG: S1 RNA-binding domain-containing protein, partial [Rhodospirillaceae bacterium]|nr:S1 RNA-binding domain-containing protein [Rhodospirillaceae bacterium]